MSRRSFGPFSTFTPSACSNSEGSTRQSPGIITRSVLGVRSVWRIKGVVIRAATLIFRAVTS
ncbi:MAG: hypothetical protein M5R38_05915 [Candidatus Methylomirabilis sp.]|nr:hypothetical protein [Candidatus Methylomirabilis sp.]